MLFNAPFWFFFNEETPELLAAILTGQHDFPEEAWKDISPQAKNFVSSLLKVNPSERMQALTALGHAWILVRPSLCFVLLFIFVSYRIFVRRSGIDIPPFV